MLLVMLAEAIRAAGNTKINNKRRIYSEQALLAAGLALVGWLV